MLTTDPIADALTRIRNASNAGHKTVEIPASNIKKSIVEILFEEGYVKKFEVLSSDVQGTIKVTLKYGTDKTKGITGIKRISKPGLRVYAGQDEIPRVLKGLGIAILSTSKGIMTDKRARREHVGGEVLAFVW